jgi:hypothetical protein
MDDRSPFQIVIPKANRPDFGRAFEDRLNERCVCATGRIEPYESRHRIVVND